MVGVDVDRRSGEGNLAFTPSLRAVGFHVALKPEEGFCNTPRSLPESPLGAALRNDSFPKLSISTTPRRLLRPSQSCADLEARARVDRVGSPRSYGHTPRSAASPIRIPFERCVLSAWVCNLGARPADDRC
jgi:hypothetical protein